MTEVMVILITAAVGFALASWWRVPAMPLLILVGVVLSLTGWSTDASTVRNAMLLGLTFLVFVVGTELDAGRVVGHWRAAASVAFAQSLELGALGFVAAKMLRFDTLAALYLALAQPRQGGGQFARPQPAVGDIDDLVDGRVSVVASRRVVVDQQIDDNHWLDCLVGCAVGASMQGAVLFGTDVRPEPKRPRIKLSEIQRQKRGW